MTLSLILYVLGVAALAALAGLAWLAALRERREGMRPDTVRPAALTAITLAALALPLLTAPAGRPAPAAPPEARGRLLALKDRCPAAGAEVDALDRELFGPAVAPAPETPAAPEAPPASSPVPPRAALVAVALLLAGLVVLLATGDRSTLPLRRWWARLRGGKSPTGEPAEDVVARAAAMAVAQRYEEALELTRGADASALPTFDLLDLLFLRAYSAAQLGFKSAGREGDAAARRKELFAQAERDLEHLLRLAPDMGEAHYLRATVRGIDGRHEDALKDFREARPRLAGQGLPFDESESACLVELAVGALEAAQADKAAAYLAEVEARKVLADQAPLARVTFRLGEVRKEFRAGRMDDVRRLLQETRAMPGLGDALRARLALVCDVYEVLTVHREGNPARSREAIERFLAAHAPADLPPVDEETADEFLDGPVAREKVALPPGVFRAFYFLLAVATARQFEATGRPMTESSASAVVTLLLRALQFSPRHRDALAGLGAVYYWFVPGKRRKGREWIRAATLLGARSAVLRRLLDEDRRAEAERSSALEAFLGASMRFLSDATVRPAVRDQLREELGRFQEFQPLLMELGDRGAIEPRPVTLDLLRQRSDYVASLADETGRRLARNSPQGLKAVSDEYRRTADTLTRAVAQIEDLERKVFSELGRALME